MSPKYLIPSLLFFVMISSCNANRCRVSCVGQVSVKAVGFSLTELNNATITSCKKNTGLHTNCYTGPLSGAWQYQSPTDTTNDTLILRTQVDPGADYILYVPLTGGGDSMFTITDMSMGGGQTSVNDYCRQGGTPSGPECTDPPWLQSFEINARPVSIASREAAIIYITR